MSRFVPLLGIAVIGLTLTAPALAQKVKAAETIGGGTVLTPAVGPAPSYGLGGPGMVLVKNWHFGAAGTIKNSADMNANFYYHDEFGTMNNGGKYGSNIVSPDFANATGGQPIEGVNSAPVRTFMADSLRTLLTPLNKVTKVQPWNHNAGNGSFMAKFRLPNGGSLLGRDIVWETRVRYVTPPYFWLGIWTAGNKWKWDGKAQGAEHDLVESFGFDNGGTNTNYEGKFWHSNTVASPTKDTVDYWQGWTTPMVNAGFANYDATQYHVWTWVYKKDNSFAMYCDGKKIQAGSNYYWTFGNTAKDEPIDMDFLFDAGWGHNEVGSVRKELSASALDGKYYEWNYSRIYLSGGGEAAKNGPHVLPGTIKAADYDIGGKGVAYDQSAAGLWRNYTVQVPVSGRYNFSFRVTSPGGGKFHLEDEKGVSLTGLITAPAKAGQSEAVTAPSPGTLSAGAHTLKWVQDSGTYIPVSLTAVKVPGIGATFIKTDLKTQGSWKGVYGADGFMIAGDDTHQPAYGTVSKTAWQALWNGNGLTKDVRAPERSGGGADRIAAEWGTGDKSYDLDCAFKDSAVHQVALYGLDWDLNGRSEDIQVIDAATGGVLDSYDLNAYTSGKYLVWNVQGHIIFRVFNTAHWTYPALSGIFFDSAKKGSAKL